MNPLLFAHRYDDSTPPPTAAEPLLKCSLCGFYTDNHPTDIPLYVQHLDTVHPGETWAIFVTGLPESEESLHSPLIATRKSPAWNLLGARGHTALSRVTAYLKPVPRH